MWKALISKGIREVRFVVKQSPEHHGVWNYIHNRVPELRMLNQNTFFSITEISDQFKTPSACHLIYVDKDSTEEIIPTENLTPAQFESILKQKVANALTLKSTETLGGLPCNIVEAGKTIKYVDDGF
jgi:hypothetical protein